VIKEKDTVRDFSMLQIGKKNLPRQASRRKKKKVDKDTEK
jgi:hypothetical protein